MVNLLIATVGTVLAAIAALIVDWLKSDARLKSVSQVFEESTKAVSLLDAWSKVYQQIEALPQGPRKETAMALADAILSQALKRVSTMPNEETASTLMGSLATRLRNLLSFLRFDAPKHPAIWLPQLAYYASLTMFILVLSRSATSLLDPALLALAAITLILWLLCILLDKAALKWFVQERPPNSNQGVTLVGDSILPGLR
jgi:hypothetical protein